MDSSRSQRHHQRHGDRKRSRSHTDHEGREAKRQSRDRSRSPVRKHRRHHTREARNDAPAVRLPFGQRPLDKRDFEIYEALFAEYLDVQKRINIQELSRNEVKGRWKSFLGKWNKKGLAEGWYDPDAKKRAEERCQARQPCPQRQSRDEVPPSKQEAKQNHAEDEEQDEEDEFGPSLPGRENARAGPAFPTLQDLQHRQELADEAIRAAKADSRYNHQMDRKDQKARLEELAPRADPGSRERQIEKKADKTSVLHSFREAKDGGEVEVKDSDLMGDDEGFKAELKKRDKVKNEREIRKEEILRARVAEREERMRGHREKEEETMRVLRGIARERFG